MKFGRRPPKGAPALRLSAILSGIIPEHPVSEDYLAQLSDWQMLGNDQYGDCVAVTWANQRRLVTALLGGHEHYPTLSDVETLYRTQNPAFPAEDNGMDIQTCLEYLVKSGGPDGVKAVAFARVDYGNPAECAAAMAIFGHLWVGINVQEANMDDFDQGLPWDWHTGSPIDGGHSVEAGGYDPANPGDDEQFITWGTETAFTDLFWSHGVEEAWVVVWPENLGTKQFQQGIDQAKLASAYEAITGRVLPVPPPSPAPSPTPNGCLDVADKALFAAVAAWMVLRHVREGRKVAQALQAWAKAKGLS
jgi:hypothetical protein